MPQATLEDSPFLGIRLDRGHTSFAPGETISGHVVRNEHMRDDDAIVAISLTGRVKTKIVVCRFKAKLCPSATMYRGWTTLIDERQSPWVLFRGVVFVPPGGAGHAWPFAITIPTHYVEAEGAPTRPLPESFTIDTAGFSRWDEGFVEYTLRAETRTAVATTHAIVPITITTTNPGLPVADIPLLPRELSNGVFWPEIGPSGPQGPRAKPKVPPLPLRIFGGHVIIDTPAIIQLEHPTPFRYASASVQTPNCAQLTMTPLP